MRTFLLAMIFLLGALLPASLAYTYPPYFGPKKPPCPPKITHHVPYKPKCPVEAPKMTGCINLLNVGGLVNIVIGKGILDGCCPYLSDLDPYTASCCLCNAVKESYPDPTEFIPHFKKLLGGCGIEPPVHFPCM